MSEHGARAWAETLRPRAWRTRCQELARLMKAERAAVLAGDLAALSDLAARIETALNDFDEASPPPTEAAERELNGLREAAASNARLLEAMIEGVSEARDRIAEVEAGRSRLGYDSRGEAVTTVRRGVERLA